MDDGKVIYFHPGGMSIRPTSPKRRGGVPADVLPFERSLPGYQDCRHGRVVLVEATRSVECKACGVQLDTFDAFMHIVREWESRMSEARMIEGDIQRRRDELAALTRRARNLGMRVRRAESVAGPNVVELPARKEPRDAR